MLHYHYCSKTRFLWVLRDIPIWNFRLKICINKIQIIGKMYLMNIYVGDANVTDFR